MDVLQLIQNLITPEVEAGMKLIVTVFCLIHFLWAVVLYRQVINATNTITTRNAGFLRTLSLVHVLVLTAVLLLVVFF